MLSKANLARHQSKEGFMQIFGRKLRKRTLYKLAASLLAIAGLIGISLCYAFTLDDYQTNARTLNAATNEFERQYWKEFGHRDNTDLSVERDRLLSTSRSQPYWDLKKTIIDQLIAIQEYSQTFRDKFRAKDSYAIYEEMDRLISREAQGELHLNSKVKFISALIAKLSE